MAIRPVSRLNRNLDMLVFVEGGKSEYPEKNPQSRDENQQQTQPTYDAESGNQTRATLVGGECSHHCAIPGPHSPTAVRVSSHNFNKHNRTGNVAGTQSLESLK